MSNQSDQVQRATWIGATTVLNWALLAWLTQVAGPVPPFLLTALAFTVASLCCAVAWHLRGESPYQVLRQPVGAWLLGVAGLFGYHALYFVAQQNAPPANAGLISYLWPLLIVIFVALLPDETLKPKHVIGGCLGLVGAFLLIGAGGKRGANVEHASYSVGYAAAFGCALVWSGYSVLARRYNNVPTATVGGFCFITAILAFVCHFLSEPTRWPSGIGWLGVIGLGLGPVGSAFFTWDVGIKHGDLRLLGLLAYFTPLISTVVLIVAGYASPTPNLAIAAVTITAGMLVGSGWFRLLGVRSALKRTPRYKSVQYMCAEQNIRAVAVAAPHWPCNKNAGSDEHLNSTIPFSLQNALRFAAYRASAGIGAWGESNWASESSRDATVYISDYWDETEAWLKQVIDDEQPNLLLIGAMSISMPGAIQIAHLAKRILSSDVLIVLGGKHCMETLFTDQQCELVVHHSNPLRMVGMKKLPPVFDLVVSGDAEELIADLGEVLAGALKNGYRAAYVPALLDTESPRRSRVEKSRGSWIMAWFDEEIRWIKSKDNPIDHDSFPVPCELFDINTCFPVFQTERTAHLYSYTSKGCIFSCHFCSEGMQVNGKLIGIKTSGLRLGRQLVRLKELAVEKYDRSSISAFVEDSILLQGNVKQLNALADYLAATNTAVPFGAQLTIDMALDPKRQIALRRLAQSGLCYVFLGLETNDEEIAATMHKNRAAIGRAGSNSDQREAETWVHRFDRVIDFFDNCGIKAGFSVLFGLGESQDRRIQMLDQLLKWQTDKGSPECVSLNWAVTHPLRELVQEVDFDYRDWAVDPEDERYELLTSMFGEVSTKYCLPNVNVASLAELEEIQKRYVQLNNTI